eukprot:9432549-Karenia_brevis.AAC.1
MTLCPLKGAEREVEYQKHKCRVVLRCDNVRDQLWPCSQQGTSAAHMVVLAIGRMPGMSAEDADAA